MLQIEMYSTQNEGKSIVAEKFIRTLNIKICKYMTSIWKNVYIDKLDIICILINIITHSIAQMKPADVKSKTYINYSKEINNKYPEFKWS